MLWEFWNYWSRAKWHYTVPIMEHLKIFEMPVPGYLGFPAFALECFTMYVFVAPALVTPRRPARSRSDRSATRSCSTAGLGTRLRPLTDVRAKPAIPVAGEPMIRRIIAWLAAQGVDDLVLNLHHRPGDADRASSATAAISARACATRGSSRAFSAAPAARGWRCRIVGADTFLHRQRRHADRRRSRARSPTRTPRPARS